MVTAAGAGDPDGMLSGAERADTVIDCAAEERQAYRPWARPSPVRRIALGNGA
jgi:hypothetical protein